MAGSVSPKYEVVSAIVVHRVTSEDDWPVVINATTMPPSTLELRVRSSWSARLGQIVTSKVAYIWNPILPVCVPCAEVEYEAGSEAGKFVAWLLDYNQNFTTR